MIIIDAEQRSEAWFAARLGKLTGSKAADMLATIKSGAPSASRRNLLTQLVLERITGRSQEREFRTSQAMMDGIEREPDARALYEGLTGRLVTETGFVQHDELAAGASLDGHVGDFNGIIEVKSPLAATHLEYLETGVIPGDYQKQILHGLWITGAEWCDWLSYCPDFPDALRVRLVRVHRNHVDIAAYELMVRAFLKEVDAKEAAVRAMLPAESAVA